MILFFATGMVRCFVARKSTTCRTSYASYVALASFGTRCGTFKDRTQRYAGLQQELKRLTPNIQTSFGRNQLLQLVPFAF